MNIDNDSDPSGQRVRRISQTDLSLSPCSEMLLRKHKCDKAIEGSLLLRRLKMNGQNEKNGTEDGSAPNTKIKNETLGTIEENTEILPRPKLVRSVARQLDIDEFTGDESIGDEFTHKKAADLLDNYITK